MLRPLEYAIIAFFVGVLFVVLAYIAGVFSFQLCWSPPAGGSLTSCDSDVADLVKKELGFFSALNWSFGLVFFFPMFVYFGTRSIQLGGRSLEWAIDKGMVRHADWRIATQDEVLAPIKARMRILVICVVAVLAIGATFIAADFYLTITVFYNDPSQLGQLKFPNPKWPVDWTMADAVCGHLAAANGPCNTAIFGRSPNEVFAAVAYAYLPWLGSAAAIGFMIGFGLFATSFGSSEFKSAGLTLIPNVHSIDPRCGFEIFESLFQHAIIACLTLFAMGYLLSLQNVYFQTPDTNILDLVIPVDFTKLASAVPQLPRYINPRIAAVSIIGLLFLLIVIVAAVSALKTAAEEGAQAILKATEDDAPNREQTIEALEIKDLAALGTRLSQPQPWPIKWPSVVTLIVWLVAATISMLVVSAGLYVIALAIIYAFGEIGFKKREEAKEKKAKEAAAQAGGP